MVSTEEQEEGLASPLLPSDGGDDNNLDDEQPSAARTTVPEDRVRSNAVVVSTFAISVLLSFSIGLTVGIVPEILTDRYARLDRGYGGDSDDYGDDYDGDGGDLLPCWRYTAATMPEACALGAVDAQTGSAYGMFVQNLLTFFFNAVIGSYSDKHGRRGPLVVSVFLNALVPASLVALELCEDLNPIWYYASNAATGVFSYVSVIFATLSDGCPEELRAGRFAMNMAGFYGAFSLAPSLATRMSHIEASWWSLGLGAASLVVSVLFLPETVTTGTDSDAGAVSEVAGSAQRHGPRRGHPQRQQQQQDDEESRTNAHPLLRPLREMTILSRDGILVLVAVASFLSAAVYSTDTSLVLFYIEEHLNVREDDIARMFFCMGLLGAILQGIGLQPLVSLLGETGLLLVTFVFGTIHNLLYGVATDKAEITLALSLSQVTKLSYPVLSSLASRRVGTDEQGRVQGALLGLNALAGAVGPVAMNWIYVQTRSGTHRHLGPGTMFVVASGLYLVGTAVVGWIHRVSPVTVVVVADAGNGNRCISSGSDNADDAVGTIGSLETPFLDDSGECVA